MNCPVCGSEHVHLLHWTPELPMSIMAVTSDPVKSVELPTSSMKIFSCDCCTHVYNAAFDPAMLTYSHGGCKMFNNGTAWQQHIKDLQEYINNKNYHLVVEIGAGDGEFLKGVKTKTLAYEPSEESELCKAAGLNTIKDYFAPGYVAHYAPGALFVMRHVMEHLQYPSDFIEQLTRNAYGITDMIIEVPNIVNALKDQRIEDWVYEHAQHFTPTSLKRLFLRCGWAVYRCETKYNNEIIVLHAKFKPSKFDLLINNYVANFKMFNQVNLDDAATEIRSMVNAGKEVVYWGGTGKSTLCLHQISPKYMQRRVVDSDIAKVGLCVPGLSTRIEHADRLINKPADIIIITTSWRAHDIVEEIKRKGIKCEKALVYKQGKLQEVYSGQ